MDRGRRRLATAAPRPTRLPGAVPAGARQPRLLRPAAAAGTGRWPDGAGTAAVALLDPAGCGLARLLRGPGLGPRLPRWPRRRAGGRAGGAPGPHPLRHGRRGPLPALPPRRLHPPAPPSLPLPLGRGRRVRPRLQHHQPAPAGRRRRRQAAPAPPAARRRTGRPAALPPAPSAPTTTPATTGPPRPSSSTSRSATSTSSSPEGRRRWIRPSSTGSPRR